MSTDFSQDHPRRIHILQIVQGEGARQLYHPHPSTHSWYPPPRPHCHETNYPYFRSTVMFFFSSNKTTTNNDAWIFFQIRETLSVKLDWMNIFAKTLITVRGGSESPLHLALESGGSGLSTCGRQPATQHKESWLYWPKGTWKDQAWIARRPDPLLPSHLFTPFYFSPERALPLTWWEPASTSMTRLDSQKN